MNNLLLLDASLRDGGHRTNFHFKDNELEGILPLLDHSGIEFIEIGYRNGSLHPINDLGRAGWCAQEYVLFCRSLIKRAKIAIMAHPKNVDEKDLRELKNCGVDLLRICVSKGDLANAIPVLQNAQKIGLMVSINFIHLSYYNNAELDELLKKLHPYKPDIIYFADSNGSLLPHRVKEVYDRYIGQYNIPFGFHAHDNIGLAQTNALAALSSGVRYIDASLAGMGKGIGNLKTEFFTAYLHAINIKKYNLEDVLNAANYVRDVLKIGHETIEMDEFIRGITDLSTADLKLYKQKLAQGNPFLKKCT
ncbi:MAG: 4-hydroxy-2-oxovalerate aldolase [Legionella sp.]|uniref:4-hydroxy-2-oxovalerate aldolase n=1 Tax=Legionella sp. TaxID=459 RepID=UPI0039E273F1